MRYFIVLCLLFSNSFFSQKMNCFDIARKGTLVQIENEYKGDHKVIDSIDENTSSMLILACYRGNKEVANFLIEKKANLDYVSTNGTALMAATVKNDLKMVTLLLENSANPNLTDANGTTALMYAVQFKNIEIVKLLIAHAADKALIDKNGKTAFEYAVFSRNEDIINLLK